MTARRWQWLALAGLALVLVWGLVVADAPADPALAVAEAISCPVCDGESVAASQSEIAESMYAQIGTLLDAGYTERETLEWFEARYGPEILLEPPLDVGGILLWTLPLLIAAGGVIVILRLRRPVAAEVTAEPPTRSGRSLLGIGISAVVLVGVAFALGSFLEPRADGSPITGQFDAPTDLESVSDETLALTIASFEGDPDVSPQQLNGMRLALAERYFEAGDYRSATEEFTTVLESEPTPAQASEALGRVGWILYVNGESAAAEEALGQALDTFDGNGEARYFLVLVLMEQDRGSEAVPLLEALLDDPSVPADLQPDLLAMLEAAKA